MGKSLVIVESPAKAKTINKYLGNQYVVKSSVGHIRDLPTSGSASKEPAKRGKSAETPALSPKEKAKRQQRRLATQGLQAVTRTCAGWYRDLAAVSVGADDAVLNQDRLPDLRAVSQPGLTLGYSRAVMAVRPVSVFRSSTHSQPPFS